MAWVNEWVDEWVVGGWGGGGVGWWGGGWGGGGWGGGVGGWGERRLGKWRRVEEGGYEWRRGEPRATQHMFASFQSGPIQT